MPLVTGLGILDLAGVPSAGRDDATLAWADACAAAITAAVAQALDIDPPTDVPPDLAGYAEVQVASQLAALELYKRRESPFGIVGYADPMGQAIRLARDYVDPIRPELARWRPTGPATLA